jgi:hypothetical protein
MTSKAKEEAQFFLNKPSPDYSWTEPPSDWDALPPLNNVIASTESGHFMEMDDTPGAERIRLQHRTGTFTEIQSTGQQIVKVIGDKYEIIAANNNVLISGICNISIEGDSIINVSGDAYSQVDGDSYMRVNGKTNINSTGKIKVVSAEDIVLFAGGATGAVTIEAAETVNINSDLNVSGSIIARQSISALQNVTAGLKLSSNLGIDTLGPITSVISVFAPLIQGLSVQDVRGTMELIRLLYNTHTHPAPRGMTGTPIPLM